ncbi:hypothetical protein AgCh_000608 [Apium graveolens]
MIAKGVMLGVVATTDVVEACTGVNYAVMRQFQRVKRDIAHVHTERGNDVEPPLKPDMVAVAKFDSSCIISGASPYADMPIHKRPTKAACLSSGSSVGVATVEGESDLVKEISVHFQLNGGSIVNGKIEYQTTDINHQVVVVASSDMSLPLRTRVIALLLSYVPLAERYQLQSLLTSVDSVLYGLINLAQPTCEGPLRCLGRWK